MNQWSFRTFVVFLLPAVLILSVLFVFPLLQMFVTSMYGTEFPSIDNYQALFALDEFGVSVRNLVVFTIVSVLGHLAIGLVIALLVNRPSRGQRLFRGIALAPWMLPPAVVATTWAWMFHSPFGIVNPILQSLGVIRQPIAWLSNVRTAMPAILVANLWRGYPFVSLIVLAGLQAIPRSLYEAAQMDGARPIQVFRWVTLPLLRNSLLTAGLLDLIGTVKYFDLVWVMTQGGPAHKTEVMATLLYKLNFVWNRPGLAASMGVILLVGLSILSLTYIRFIPDTE